jgi:hypothetical protein
MYNKLFKKCFYEKKFKKAAIFLYRRHELRFWLIWSVFLLEHMIFFFFFLSHLKSSFEKYVIITVVYVHHRHLFVNSNSANNETYHRFLFDEKFVLWKTKFTSISMIKWAEITQKKNHAKTSSQTVYRIICSLNFYFFIECRSSQNFYW